jgi:hypothetical protein
MGRALLREPDLVAQLAAAGVPGVCITATVHADIYSGTRAWCSTGAIP